MVNIAPGSVALCGITSEVNVPGTGVFATGLGVAAFTWDETGKLKRTGLDSWKIADYIPSGLWMQFLSSSISPDGQFLVCLFASMASYAASSDSKNQRIRIYQLDPFRLVAELTTISPLLVVANGNNVTTGGVWNGGDLFLENQIDNAGDYTTGRTHLRRTADGSLVRTIFRNIHNSGMATAALPATSDTVRIAVNTPVDPTTEVINTYLVDRAGNIIRDDTDDDYYYLNGFYVKWGYVPDFFTATTVNVSIADSTRRFRKSVEMPFVFDNDAGTDSKTIFTQAQTVAVIADTEEVGIACLWPTSVIAGEYQYLKVFTFSAVGDDVVWGSYRSIRLPVAGITHWMPAVGMLAARVPVTDRPSGIVAANVYKLGAVFYDTKSTTGLNMADSAEVFFPLEFSRPMVPAQCPQGLVPNLTGYPGSIGRVFAGR